MPAAWLLGYRENRQNQTQDPSTSLRKGAVAESAHAGQDNPHVQAGRDRCCVRLGVFLDAILLVRQTLSTPSTSWINRVLRSCSVLRADGQEHRNTASILGVFCMKSHQVAFLELNCNQDVCSGCYCEHEMRGCHQRRRPEHEKPAYI